MKLLKRLTVVAALAVVVGATMASPAFATGTKWNVTGGYSGTLKGTLTLKKAGASPVTCSLSAPIGTLNEGTALIGLMANPVTTVNTKCSNGLYWTWSLESEVFSESGKLWIYFAGCCGEMSVPWTARTMLMGYNTERAPFINGSGITASHIDFKETKLGETNVGESVTATGSLEVYRSKSELLSVSTF